MHVLTATSLTSLFVTKVLMPKKYNIVISVLFFTALCSFRADIISAVKVNAGLISPLLPSSVMVKVEVKNYSNKPIKIPINRGIDFLRGRIKPPGAVFLFEVEKKVKNNYERINPTSDYNPSYIAVVLTNLRKYQAIADTINIASFWGRRFPKGDFRVRVWYKASDYNRLKDIPSNWAEFKMD